VHGAIVEYRTPYEGSWTVCWSLTGVDTIIIYLYSMQILYAIRPTLLYDGQNFHVLQFTIQNFAHLIRQLTAVTVQ